MIMRKSISLCLLLMLLFGGAGGCIAAEPPGILAYYDSDAANDDRLAKLGGSFNQVSTDNLESPIAPCFAKKK